MKEVNEKKIQGLVTAVAVLSLVVAAQSVWMFLLTRTPHAEPSTESPAQAVQAETRRPQPAQPPAVRSAPQDPWNDLFRAWDPLEEMDRMRRQMDQLFNDAFGQFPQGGGSPSRGMSFSFNPNLDLEETPDAYILRMDVPGAEEADVHVTLENQVLSVEGNTDYEASETAGTSLRRERRSGRFSRSVRLPEDIADQPFDAEIENGVLTVTVPRLPPLST